MRVRFESPPGLLVVSLGIAIATWLLETSSPFLGPATLLLLVACSLVHFAWTGWAVVIKPLLAPLLLSILVVGQLWVTKQMIGLLLMGIAVFRGNFAP